MKRFRPKLWLVVITPLLAVGLAACGASTPSATTESSTVALASAPETSAPAAAATPAASSEPSAVASTAETSSAAAAEATAPATASSAAETSSAAEASSTAEASSATEATAANTKFDLNTVSEDQLLSTIPDFGNRMVREFMEYRPYISITQFRREIGKYVDAEQVALYEQYVYVPVDVNNADAATLQQLPGVDASIAEQLIAARSYDSNATFLAKLAEYVSPADAAAAQGYLAAQ